MEINFNLSSLKIVYGPIVDYLKEAQLNIEQNLNLMKNDGKVPTDYSSINLINKVEKTLKMIGILDLNKVLELVEKSLIELKNVTYDSQKSIQILELNLEITKAAIFYLDSLLNSQKIQGIKFFNLYKSLANLMDKNVSIKDLFFVKLDTKESLEELIQKDLKVGIFINENNKKNLVAHLEKVYSHLQIKLPEIINVVSGGGKISDKNQYQTLCKNVYEALDYSQKLKISKNLYILFGLQKLYICILSPIFNQSFESYVQENKNNIVEVLKNILVNFKNIIETVVSMSNGEKTGTLKADDETVKNLVYELVYAIRKNTKLKEMPVYKDLNNYFDLDFYTKQLDETSIEIKEEINIELLEKIFIEIKEDFNVVESKKNSDFSVLESALMKIINSQQKFINNLHDSSVKDFVKNLKEIFHGIKDKKIQLSDSLSRELALSLVLIEYGLNNFVKNHASEASHKEYKEQLSLENKRLIASQKEDLSELNNLSLPKLDTLSQKTDERKVFGKIFEQINLDLTKIEEILNKFFSEEKDYNEVEQIIKPLSGMKGIFAIIGKKDLNFIVDDIINVWSTIIQNKNETSVSEEEIKKSILLVSGLSLFINAFKSENDVEAEEIYQRLIEQFKEEHHSSISTVPEVLEQHLPTQIETQTQENNVQSLTTEEEPSSISIVNNSEEKIHENKEGFEFLDKPNDEDLCFVFVEEAKEVLDNLNSTIKNLNEDINNAEELKSLRRFYHTLKGSGRMVGLIFVGEAAWIVEQTLNKCLSSDITFSNDILNAIEKVTDRIKNWISIIESNNQVEVNLSEIKKEFLVFNPSLTTQIEIPDVVENMVQKEQEHEIIELEQSSESNILENEKEENLLSNESINIDSIDLLEENQEIASESNILEEILENVEVEQEQEQEIQPENIMVEEKIKEQSIEIDHEEKEESNNSLLKLFEDESKVHIEALKKMIVDNDDGLLNEEFMRHAHTLSSISKAFNFNNIATIAYKIENIANLSLENEQELLKEEIFDLQMAIFNLEAIKNNNTELFESSINLLNKISERLLNNVNVEVTSEENIETENVNIHNNLIQEDHIQQLDEKEEIEEFKEDDMNKLIEKMTNNIKDIFNESIENIQSSLENINVDRNKDKELSETKHQEMKEMLEQSVKSISFEMDKQYENIKNSLEKEKQQEKELLEQVSQKMRDVEKLVEELKTKQLELENEGKNNIESVRKDIRVLANIIKKKSELTYQEFFSKIVREKGLINLVSESNIVNSSNLQIEEIHNQNVIIEEEKNNDSNAVQLEDQALEVDSSELSSITFEQVEEPKVDNIEEQALEVNSFEELEPIAFEQVQGPKVDSIEEQALEVNSFEELEPIAFEQVQEPSVDSIEEQALEVNSFEELEPIAFEQVQEPSVDSIEEQALEVDSFEELEPIAFEQVQEPSVDSIEEQALEVDSFEELEPITFEKPNENNSDNNSDIVNFLNNHEYVKNIFEEKISTVEDEVDNDIFEISKVEAEEMLEKIDASIEKINENGLIQDELLDLKRNIHTLKGSVRMAGANKVGMLAHRLESLLDYVESRKINLFEVKPIVILEIEKIKFLMIRLGEVLKENELFWIDNLVIEQENKKEQEIEASVQNENKTLPIIKKEQQQYIRVLSDTINSMINNAGEIRLKRIGIEGVIESSEKTLKDLNLVTGKLLGMLKEIEIQAESQIQAHANELDQLSENFDPLEFDRFTRLQELTRFMNEAVIDIQDSVYNLENLNKLENNNVSQQAYLTNNLLDDLIKVRLIPFESISDRLYKIARNTAKELNKKVILELIGEKTEIDRFILDKVTSPIEHILRNCIAHGIEEPEIRENKGKLPIGKIKFETQLNGKFIEIKIEDDGAGINIEKIREIAIRKGLINQNVQYNKDQIIGLIFESGFSTAETVSQVAGRGVGMDVVKNEIGAIGGTIKIETEKDKGSTFILTIPSAISTEQAMLCEIMSKLVVIPTWLVEEILSIKQNEFTKIYANKNNIAEIKNEKYPFYYLGHLLGLLDFNKEPEIKTYNSVIKVKYLNEIMLIHIDKIITTNEILMKPIGKIFEKIRGILGSTLLGNGKQGLVLNPILLKEHYKNHIISIKEVENSQEKEHSNTTTIMIVDDSMTVRRAATKTLEKYNYNIITAKDGEDALEQLQIMVPNLILSDIEMPKMDGFDLLKNIRNIDKYKDIPVIMITSRTAEKHKNHALALGANGFLGKPYIEEELISEIERLIKK
jgi:chemosensory pili system protein ChpA (sensor histidine kinase/response regulator)